MAVVAGTWFSLLYIRLPVNVNEGSLLLSNFVGSIVLELRHYVLVQIVFWLITNGSWGLKTTHSKSIVCFGEGIHGLILQP